MSENKKCGVWGKYFAGDRIFYIKDKKIYRVTEYERDYVPEGRIPIVLENAQEHTRFVPIDDIERVKI